ncbi:MAG TPA: glycosyltransferase family 4 protein [Phycisphaerae bacterium]|jgi:hypothetical protein
MATRILHVLDATTPADAVDVLSLILPRHEHRLAALGHRSTRDLAASAGIHEPITFLHSMGWPDPTGWRGVHRLIKEYKPTHVHAWGIPAAIAVTMSRFKGQRLVTLVDLPKARHLQLLSFIHKGGLYVSVSPCHWTVNTSWLKRELHSHSIAADAVTLIRPALNGNHDQASTPAALREELGILPEDGPIIVLGGDGGIESMFAEPGMDPLRQGGRGGARHDLGLWSTAVLQTIFPRIKTIVREDPRGRTDHGLERLFNKLPDDDVAVVAPRHWSWTRLMSLADVLLVTPDGPFAAGSILHAFAAKVPVVGTPVDAVREHVMDGHNGMLASAVRVRAITAAMEAFFSDPGLRARLTLQALLDVGGRHDLSAMLRGYDSLYA